MLQPHGDHHVVQLSEIQQMEENVPMKTRLPQSEIYQQQQQQQQQYQQQQQQHQQQQQQQYPLRERYEQQQQFYEQVHQKEPLRQDSDQLQTSIYAVPNRPYSKEPQILCCGECNKAVMTDVVLRAGWGSCLCGFLMCLSPLIFLFFLPCCMRVIMFWDGRDARMPIIIVVDVDIKQDDTISYANELQLMQKVKVPDDIQKFYGPYQRVENINRIQVRDTYFDLDQQYELLSVIGQGSYGIVVAAKDNTLEQDNNLVAIKKIMKAFEHKIYAKRTLRELRLLRILKHDNIISVDTLLLPKSRMEFEDIYVVQQLMETDLSAIIRQQQALTEEHHQFFLYQILRGLKYIHSANVVHRDLKPKNLLINSNCDLKICDFGLARPLLPQLKQNAHIYTPYVQTRWYRAPELLLSWQEYDYKVDMWSVGCIFAEMLRRRPFLPGTDTKNQIEMVFDVIGTPSNQEMDLIPIQERSLAKRLPSRPGRDFHKLFPTASNEAIDLLHKLLTFNSHQRISVEEALNHPYLASQHFPEDEPISVPVKYQDFEFEEYNLTVEQWKGISYYQLDCIYEEILLYHFKDFREEYKRKNMKGESHVQHIVNNSNSKIIDSIADADEDDDDDDDADKQ